MIKWNIYKQNTIATLSPYANSVVQSTHGLGDIIGDIGPYHGNNGLREL
jgi:hypothetical protein